MTDLSALPQNHYGAILMDPEWSFEAYKNKNAIAQRSAQSHYEVSPFEKLKTRPVAGLAAQNCALFMWVVSSHLHQGIRLMEEWGFAYKSLVFVWVKTAKNGKPRMSMGLWSRQQSEVCLLGTRGKPRRLSKGVRQVIMAPRREHSRKPDIYDRIEALVGGPYLEMNARQRWPGWDAWGNETDKFQVAA